MSKSFNYWWISSGVMVACLATSTVAHGETGPQPSGPFSPLSEGETELPSDLVDESGQPEPSGPCSQCTVRTIKQSEQSEQSESEAVLEIYLDDPQQSFCGSLELEVWLIDGTVEYVIIEDVVLGPQVVSSFALDDDSYWTWERASQLLVTPISEC